VIIDRAGKESAKPPHFVERCIIYCFEWLTLFRTRIELQLTRKPGFFSELADLRVDENILGDLGSLSICTTVGKIVPDGLTGRLIEVKAVASRDQHSFNLLESSTMSGKVVGGGEAKDTVHGRVALRNLVATARVGVVYLLIEHPLPLWYRSYSVRAYIRRGYGRLGKQRLYDARGPSLACAEFEDRTGLRKAVFISTETVKEDSGISEFIDDVVDRVTLRTFCIGVLPKLYLFFFFFSNAFNKRHLIKLLQGKDKA
jgi:hypothetical protein